MTDLLQGLATDGFVVAKQFVSGRELSELVAHVERFVGDVAPHLPPEQVFYEDKRDPATLKQIQHLDDHDPWFHELLTAGRFRELAERACGGPVITKNLQYFNKPPGVGRPTPPHQDGFYFMLEPCEAVTMWLAIDDVDEQNGCVRYVKGSHQLGMRRHARTDTLGFSQGIADYPTDCDREQEVTVPAKSGDLLIHHAMTIHRADANRSVDRSRRALGFVYFSERACEDNAAQTEYQRKLAKEMKRAGKI